MTTPRPTPVPVPHALNCLCRACCDARRDEAQARKEELAGPVRAAFFEATVPLAKVRRRKPMPGTLRALAKMSRGPS